MPTVLRTAATALVVAAVLGGTRAVAAPTYHQAANRACAARNAAENRVEPQDQSDAGQLLGFFRGIAAAQRTLVAQLDALRPPRSDRPPFRRLVVAERAVRPYLDKAVRLLTRGVTPARVEALVAPGLLRASATVTARAQRLGLHACASP